MNACEDFLCDYTEPGSVINLSIFSDPYHFILIPAVQSFNPNLMMLPEMLSQSLTNRRE